MHSRVVVVGAGIGGLAAAVWLAARGLEVCVLERADEPGGKLRAVCVDGLPVDAGPTVFTLRPVFDELCEHAGVRLDELIELRPARILARHAWREGGRLDLHADLGESAEAIGRFAGGAEARRFLDFCAQARKAYRALEHTHIRAPFPSLARIARSAGWRNWSALGQIAFRTLARELERRLADRRLRQLFGRYATYCGTSPYEAPATLMLIAHVERQGVWLVQGGMHRLAQAFAALAEARGARLRFRAPVAEILVQSDRASGVRLVDGERIAAQAIVLNADVAALANGRFGPHAARAVRPVPVAERSLSAVTWALYARTEGFPLDYHNVFFSDDYAAEFEELRRQRLPSVPTVYVCAQDRGAQAPAGPERLLCLVNAPPLGDLRPLSAQALRFCEERTFRQLAQCGLRIEREAGKTVLTGPAEFERMYPGTGGALYGPAIRGWRAPFRRPGVRTRLPGLYLAGGSVHPGPGVPMAALSGMMAAECLLADLTSPRRSRAAATPGGISTR